MVNWGLECWECASMLALDMSGTWDSGTPWDLALNCVFGILEDVGAQLNTPYLCPLTISYLNFEAMNRENQLLRTHLCFMEQSIFFYKSYGTKCKRQSFIYWRTADLYGPLVFTGFQGMEYIWEMTGWSYQTLRKLPTNLEEFVEYASN